MTTVSPSLLANRHGHAVGAAATRIAKGAIFDIAQWRTLEAANRNAGLHRFARDESLKVAAELSQILGPRHRLVQFKCAVDHRLRQARIEIAARALRHQDQRIGRQPQNDAGK
jgi:hypothetical protein